MTIQEYLQGVPRIYYQLSIIVKGKQLLAVGNNLLLKGESLRLTPLCGKVRFTNLSIPATTEIDTVGEDFAVINYGQARLTIWPKGE